MRTLIFAAVLAVCCVDLLLEVSGPHQTGTMTYSYLDGAAPKVDLLFVIDSSAAMTPYAAQVEHTLELVASAAETRLRGPRAHLHVGVLTGDMSAGGAMRCFVFVVGLFLFVCFFLCVVLCFF